VVPRIVQDERVKVGVMGDFTGAGAELGRKIAEECAGALAGLIRELEAAEEDG
jgi:creatinine amidohydrolase/Fe(II)-dependent formamide hydrolase-like protein